MYGKPDYYLIIDDKDLIIITTTMTTTTSVSEFYFKSLASVSEHLEAQANMSCHFLFKSDHLLAIVAVLMYSTCIVYLQRPGRTGARGKREPG